MTNKSTPWNELIAKTTEAKFDSRLVEKRVDEGFDAPEAYQDFLKALPEETEFDVVDLENLDDDSTPATAE